MAERRKITLEVEGHMSFDSAAKSAQEAVDSGRADGAAIFDAATGEIVTEVRPITAPKVSFGTSATYRDAWDQMMERRTKRENQGSKISTDA